ncbi:MAG: hypothetical protein IJE43_00125 [Alphaproteobacteria bacterium]|nr:hypothetical protein [Alphaproteobacteria bacterium]
MTLIVSWAGLDCKKEGNKVSSIYFASDSRFSWKEGNRYRKFDEGIKVFCSSKRPYIFAYCGDVVFPNNSIDRLISKIDNDLLFPKGNIDFNEKLKIICSEIETSVQSYPFPDVCFSILVATRESYYDFHIGKIVCNKKRLSYEEGEFPSKSDEIYVEGSGAKDFERIKRSLKFNINEGTSRFYFHCLSKTIKDCESDSVGGVPQLVGLFRQGPGIIFGIIEGDNRYILSNQINYSEECLNIQWRNSNFERINPETMSLQEGAQAQPF